MENELPVSVLVWDVDGYQLRARFTIYADARAFVEAVCLARHRVEYKGKIIGVWDSGAWQPEDLWF